MKNWFLFYEFSYFTICSVNDEWYDENCIFIGVARVLVFALCNVHSYACEVQFVDETILSIYCTYKYLVQCVNECVLLNRCFERKLDHNICICKLIQVWEKKKTKFIKNVQLIKKMKKKLRFSPVCVRMCLFRWSFE